MANDAGTDGNGIIDFQKFLTMMARRVEGVDRSTPRTQWDKPSEFKWPLSNFLSHCRSPNWYYSFFWSWNPPPAQLAGLPLLCYVWSQTEWFVLVQLWLIWLTGQLSLQPRCWTWENFTCCCSCINPVFNKNTFIMSLFLFVLLECSWWKIMDGFNKMAWFIDSLMPCSQCWRLFQFLSNIFNPVNIVTDFRVDSCKTQHETSHHFTSNTW